MAICVCPDDLAATLTPRTSHSRRLAAPLGSRNSYVFLVDFLVASVDKDVFNRLETVGRQCAHQAQTWLPSPASNSGRWCQGERTSLSGVVIHWTQDNAHTRVIELCCGMSSDSPECIIEKWIVVSLNYCFHW